MVVFTLDTSCVIHAAQQQEQAGAIEALIEAAREGRVELWLTAAFDADMTRASSENLRANLGWLASQPVLRDVPGPFRLDYSAIGGPDVIVSEQQSAVIQRIEEVVLPIEYRRTQLRAGDDVSMAKWRRKVNDVQHLSAHYMAGHDAFVTSDHDDIVKNTEALRQVAGISVYTPDQALRSLERERH